MHKDMIFHVKIKLFVNCAFNALLIFLSSTSPSPWVNFTNVLRVRKLRAQICAYVLGLYFVGARLLAQKLHIERWLN